MVFDPRWLSGDEREQILGMIAARASDPAMQGAMSQMVFNPQMNPEAYFQGTQGGYADPNMGYAYDTRQAVQDLVNARASANPQQRPELWGTHGGGVAPTGIGEDYTKAMGAMRASPTGPGGESLIDNPFIYRR